MLRLAPTWVPRSFLQPGQRIKLHPDDPYAYGANRGGIDERWFASTTEAANEGRVPDEGLSYCVVGKRALHAARRRRRLRRDADRQDDLEEVRHAGRSTRSSSTTWGRSRTTCTRAPSRPSSSARKASPRAYYFPPQHNNVGNNFPYTFIGLEPGTTKAQVRKCLENWNKGDNGILDLSKAYRLKPGTGWLVRPCILHAPGSLCTYEPQWGSDVFGMYQSLVEGRYVPWSLLVKDMPKSKHQDLDFIVDQLDWEKNVDPNFKDNHYLEPVPVADTRKEGYVDRWIVYGKVDGEQLFTAKELTVDPGAKCTIKDNGAYGLICVQGSGKINGQPLNSPKLIRFTELTEDEYFCTEDGAKAGVTFENTSETEPLVVPALLRPGGEPGRPRSRRREQKALRAPLSNGYGVSPLGGSVPQPPKVGTPYLSRSPQSAGVEPLSQQQVQIVNGER